MNYVPIFFPYVFPGHQGCSYQEVCQSFQNGTTICQCVTKAATNVDTWVVIFVIVVCVSIIFLAFVIVWWDEIRAWVNYILK